MARAPKDPHAPPGGHGEGEHHAWDRDRYGSVKSEDRGEYGSGWDRDRHEYGRGQDDEPAASQSDEPEPEGPEKPS